MSRALGKENVCVKKVVCLVLIQRYVKKIDRIPDSGDKSYVTEGLG